MVLLKSFYSGNRHLEDMLTDAALIPLNFEGKTTPCESCVSSTVYVIAEPVFERERT